MTIIFQEMFGEIVECYIDNLVIKLRGVTEYLEHLKMVSDKLQVHELKMNQIHVQVNLGKLLGFVVHHWEIKIDPAMIKATIELPTMENVRELRGFQGRITYIRRFIFKMLKRSQPFSKLMRKDAQFNRDEDCQKAFDSIKAYLTKPPSWPAQLEGSP